MGKPFRIIDISGPRTGTCMINIITVNHINHSIPFILTLVNGMVESESFYFD
jgi:hypothetical protein